MATSEPLWTYEQLSKATGVPVGTWRAKVSRREVPHVRLGPRNVRFQPSAIADYIARHVVAPIPKGK